MVVGQTGRQVGVVPRPVVMELQTKPEDVVILYHFVEEKIAVA